MKMLCIKLENGKCGFIGKNTIIENNMEITLLYSDGITMSSYIKPGARPQVIVYNSWKGYNKWVENIYQTSNMSEAEIKLRLIVPNHDLDIVLNSATQDEIEYLATEIKPFMFDQDYMFEFLNIWFLSGYKNSGIYPRVILNNLHIIQKAGIKTYAELKRVNELNQVVLNKEYLDKWTTHKLYNLSFIQQILFLKYGVVPPKMEQILSKIPRDLDNYTLTLRVIVNTITLDMLKKVNPAYFNGDYPLHLTNWVKTGIPLKEFFLIEKEFNSFSKKELSSYMEQHGSVLTLTEVDRLFRIEEAGSVLGITIPKVWYSYIKTVNVLKWADAKKAQLEKTRTVYGPLGQQATMHYHQLLKYVTDEMLVNGPKTAWRSVMQALEEIQRKLIEDQMGKLVEFKIPKNVVNISRKYKEIKVLQTNHALRDEGNAMDHCVGGYVRLCISGKSFIAHVGNEAPNGATIEFGKSENKWVCFQKRTINNGEPDLTVSKIVDEFIDELNVVEKKGGEKRV